MVKTKWFRTMSSLCMSVVFTFHFLCEDWFFSTSERMKTSSVVEVTRFPKRSWVEPKDVRVYADKPDEGSTGDLDKAMSYLLLRYK